VTATTAKRRAGHWVSTLPIVTDLDSEPVVGDWYRVPHVVSAWGNMSGCWPVSGPLHDDTEILEQPWRHYHYDPRFMTSDDVNRLCDNQRHPIEGAGEGRQRLFGTVLVPLDDGGPILLPSRCKRRMPRYIAARHLPWLPVLEEAFRGRRADCRTCPHKGLPLASLPVDADGAVTCRGHGLRWDRATGELRPRSGP
jgi:hypothetical protein